VAEAERLKRLAASSLRAFLEDADRQASDIRHGLGSTEMAVKLMRRTAARRLDDAG